MGIEQSVPALLESLKIVSSQENSEQKNYLPKTKLVAKDREFWFHWPVE